MDVRGGGRSPRAGHLCLLLGLSKGGPCPRTETGRGGPSSQMTTFLSGELQGLEKGILALWKVHTFSGRRRTFSGMFFKVKALRKGKPGDQSQEDTCLQFSQVEGTSGPCRSARNTYFHRKSRLHRRRYRGGLGAARGAGKGR